MTEHLDRRRAAPSCFARTAAAALCAVALSLAAPGPARAQSFGQNKVQYKRFDW